MPAPTTPHFGLDRTIELAGRSLPPALATHAAVTRAAGALAGVPAAITDWLYFECRLGGADAAVDVSLRVESRERDALGGLGSGAVPNATHLGRLARWWGEGDGAALARLWLEFDVPAAGGPPPAAGVFLELPPGARRDRAFIARATLALAPRPGAPQAARVAHAVARSAARLPPHAAVMYLGHFAHRAADSIRLCIVGLRDGEVVPYVTAVGWRGDADALERLLAAAAPHARHQPSVGVVNVDVGRDGARPRLGFEYLLERPPQLRGALPGSALLDHFVALGLCDPARRTALACWPGHAYENFPHELWPSVVVRHVNHVKLVVDDERGTELKAYLGYAYGPRPSTRARAAKPENHASTR